MMGRMRRRWDVVVAIAALVALVAEAHPTPAVAGIASVRPRPWTIMVYLDGDNNLDPWGQYTLDLMAEGLTVDDNVNIVVFYDHWNADGAEMLEVTSSGLNKIADVPEPDMAAPATLSSFMAWAMKTYPAEKYVLDIWDHGCGWIYLCSDDSSESEMLVADLAKGIAAGEQAAGDRVDMVLFEACNMGEIEVTYQLRSLTKVIVGTELTQDYEGVPWDTLLVDLNANPDMTAWRLGKLMVDGLVWVYTHDNKHAKAIGTLACFKAAKQAAVAKAFDGLSLSLLRNMKKWNGAVGSAGSMAKNQIWCGGVSGIFWFADAWVFADQIEKKVADLQVDYWAAELKKAIRASLYEQHTNVIDGKCYGMSVSFPPNRAMYDMKNWLRWDYAGIGLAFTADTHYDEMLRAYYALSGND